MVPPEINAHAFESPTATCCAFEIPETVTGELRLIFVPSPNWPELFKPQHFTAPVESNAHVSRLKMLAAICAAEFASVAPPLFSTVQEAVVAMLLVLPSSSV